MNKSITFLLSGSGERPVGGFRIVYEYANRLAERGWRVTIVHPAHLWPKFSEVNLLWKLRMYVRYFRRVVSKGYLPNHWMKINPKVHMKWTLTLIEKFIPNADYVVACPAQSAFFVEQYALNKGEKVYFIQHFEDWDLPKEQLVQTWKMPLKKIVIAKWLQDIAHSLNEEAIYIPNGMDFSFFKKLKVYQDRPFYSMCFLYHNLKFKGTKYAIEAIKILKQKYPQLTVSIFSAEEINEELPGFITKHINPKQDALRNIYNSNAIFLSPSLAEGWPLPPAEAMLCGCVVIATDIGGHREYIEDGINGFFCKSGSVESIIEKVEYVFAHPDLATAISDRAPESLKRFDWDSRIELFEQALLTKDILKQH